MVQVTTGLLERQNKLIEELRNKLQELEEEKEHHQVEMRGLKNRLDSTNSLIVHAQQGIGDMVALLSECQGGSWELASPEVLRGEEGGLEVEGTRVQDLEEEEDEGVHEDDIVLLGQEFPILPMEDVPHLQDPQDYPQFAFSPSTRSSGVILNRPCESAEIL